MIMDIRHKKIQEQFFKTCDQHSMTRVDPTPLLAMQDNSVYFVSATITKYQITGCICGNHVSDYKIYTILFMTVQKSSIPVILICLRLWFQHDQL